MNTTNATELSLATTQSITDTSDTITSEDKSPSELYLTSFTRFVIYSTIRSLEAIIGIIGNILTLIVIGTLKYRSNVHTLMIYLAVSDILVCSGFPLAVYIFGQESRLFIIDNWKILCIFKEGSEVMVTIGCMLSYTILAVDR